MPYEAALRRLLSDVVKNEDVEESAWWLLIYAKLFDQHGPKMLRGSYADELKEAPVSVVAHLVDMYETQILNRRYTNADDVFEFRNLPSCPILGCGVKPLDIGVSTIDALETLWERFYGLPYDQSQHVPHFEVMMVRLLRITLHLEWAGFGGFATFDRKWSQLKNWKRGDVLDPMAGQIVCYFLAPMSWMNDFIPQILPNTLKKRLYTEATELYTSDVLDPTYWDGQAKQDALQDLSRAVEADETLDDTFKKPFRQWLGDQDDGDQVREASHP